MTFFLFFLLVPFVQCAILASSKVTSCVASVGDLSLAPCKTQMVVTLTIDGGANGTEVVEATITSALDDQGRERKLARPVRVFVSKTKPFLSYPLTYLQTVNAKPVETVSGKAVLCGSNLLDQGCGFFKDSKGVQIPFSDGFCCPCDPASGLLPGSTTSATRGACVGVPLGALGSGASSCLRFGDLWYSAYSIGAASTFWSIGVTVRAFNDSTGVYTDREALAVSPSSPAARTRDGSVVVRALGDLAPFSEKPVLSERVLLAASTPSAHARVKEGVQGHLLVPSTMVDLTGNTCDKIGVGFAGFANQANRCGRPAGSCLGGQIDDLYAADAARRAQGKTPLYFLDYLRPVDTAVDASPSSGVLRQLLLGFEERHTTVLTLTLNADSIKFIALTSPGRITAAAVAPFEAQTRDGRLEVTVRNTGAELACEYLLSVTNCGPAVLPVPAKTLTIQPGASAPVSFDFHVVAEKGLAGGCLLTLAATADMTTHDTRLVNFTATAVVETKGAQGGAATAGSGTSSVQSKAALTTSAGNGSGCHCSGFFSLLCFVSKQACWINTLKAVLTLVAIVIAITLAIRVAWWCLIQRRWRHRPPPPKEERKGESGGTFVY
jgi:hypothetical protein